MDLKSGTPLWSIQDGLIATYPSLKQHLSCDVAIIGGEDDSFHSPLKRDHSVERKSHKLAERFRTMFPAIDLEVAYAWGGTFGETKDGLAYIGATEEFPNAYFVLGYGGNGVTYSAVAAEIVRDLYLGRPNSDAALFRFDR
jgi:glycine/D-amino acid oxidase-like deaminating enzyme